MRAVAANDDMVVKRDTDELSRLAESLRLGDVFFRWRRVAAWMVVRHDQRHSAQPNRLAEDVARMKKCLVRRAARDPHRLAKKMALCVKIERERALLRLVNSHGSHLPYDVIRRFDSAGKRTVRRASIALHERECGSELHSGYFADSRHLRRDDLLPGGVYKVRRASEVINELASGISRSGSAERMNASRGRASGGKSLIFSVSAMPILRSHH